MHFWITRLAMNTCYTPPKRRSHPEIKPITDRTEVSVVTPSSLYSFFKAEALWRTWGISNEPSVANVNVFHGLSNELPVNLPQR
jgi:hypothetical protein